MKDQVKETSMFNLVQQWIESGKSQKEFSEENNIKLHTFIYWVQKFRHAESMDKGFASLNISHEPGREEGTSPKIEIELAGGIIVRIY